MLNKRLVRADLVLHVPRFEHQIFGISCCRWFLFPGKHHSQGFLGSELAWDVQIGGLLHRRAVIFVIITRLHPQGKGGPKDTLCRISSDSVQPLDQFVHESYS